MANGNRCPICNRSFVPSDKIVRIVAEIVERDPDKDGADDDYWSKIVDWDLVTKVHLRCAKRAIMNEDEFDYCGEIAELPLFDPSEVSSGVIHEDRESEYPVLRLVEGGLG